MSRWLKRLLACIAVLPALTVPLAATQGPQPVVYRWHTFFGGDANSGTNVPASALDAYGNLYVTGWTQYPWDTSGSPILPYPAGAFQGYLAKISPTGQLLWSKFYPGYGQSSSGLQPTAIALDSAGNIYLAGNGNSENNGNYGCFVMETDSAGIKIAGANFGYVTYGRTCAVSGLAYDPVQNYVYLTGSASGGWQGGQLASANPGLPPNGAQAMFILQAQGGMSGMGLGWVGFYGAQDAQGNGLNAVGAAIAVDASSNLIVAGSDNGNAGWDVAVWKVSTAGQQAWERTYGLGTSFGVALYGASVYITGFSPAGWNGPASQGPLNDFAYGDSRGAGAVTFVLKLDTGGTYLWHTFYHGNNEASKGQSIAVDGPTKVYVDGQGDLVGYGEAPPRHSATSGHFILQLDDAGAYQWHSNYANTGWDSANSIAVDAQHNVFVSGWTSWTNWTADGDAAPLVPLYSSSLFPANYEGVFVMKFGPGSQTTPALTWSAPAPITYGSALGNGQLNASANVSGTFVYTPPAGTVLPVGNGQTLSVTFTPADAADYTAASCSTTINVNAAPPPPSGVNLVVTKVLSRSAGNVVVQLTISNTGGTAANNVKLTTVKVGTVVAAPLPQTIGTLGANSSAQVTVSVPGTVGTSGTASSLTAAGTYTGGSFSLSMRITLP
jgi:hypothetical protein